MRTGLLVALLCIAASTIVAAQAPMPAPPPGPATDRASVIVVMRAVNERLAWWSALASVSDSATAWMIQTPDSSQFWKRAQGWLVATLQARAPRDPRESPQQFVKITSAIVRGDSLIASFYLGSTYPDQHRSPSTVYRVRAKWSQYGWGTPVVEPTLYVD